jgi:hypothetical protein
MKIVLTFQSVLCFGLFVNVFGFLKRKRKKKKKNTVLRLENVELIMELMTFDSCLALMLSGQ